MHALFQTAPLDELPKRIPEDAIKAAVSLVQLCNLNPAIIAGREIADGQILPQTQLVSPQPMVQPLDEDRKLQQLVVTQPGPIISASRLTHLNKFRSNGGKQRVLLTFTAIANKNLATVCHRKGNVSVN